MTHDTLWPTNCPLLTAHINLCTKIQSLFHILNWSFSVKTTVLCSFSNYQLNAQLFYFSTICILHYVPQHVSSSTLLILRRTNCITTASGIVTLCKQLYSMQVESGLSPLSTCILYGCLQRVTIPEAVLIQLVLLRMSSVLLETCWGT